MYLGGRVSFLQYKVIGYVARDLDRFRKQYNIRVYPRPMVQMKKI